MHVVYIHQHFATRQSATGTRSYEMSRCLIDAGHRVSMICGVNDATAQALRPEARITRRTIDGIDVYCIAEPYSNRMGFARRIWAFWRFMRDAQRVAYDLDGDLVFATSTPLTVGIPGMKAARRRRVPFVFEVRDLWPELPIALGVLRNPVLIWYTRRMERRIYFAAERIIALAPGIRDGICRTGYPPDRVTMIPNGCDLDLFQPTDERLDDPRFGSPDELRLVFCGAHGLANGLDAVLDAARVLLDQRQGGIRFIFIGHGSQRDRLIQRSRREGTDRIITWLPFVPKAELARILPRLDVGMMILRNCPGFYYGTSPNKFFDYIASGIPVINNYPGWLADMIRERDCGRVVPPDDPHAFADTVVWMRDHRDELRAMGRRGRALAEEKFDRHQLGQAFVRVLQEARDTYASG